jgi:hypothetical protein
MAHTPTIMKIVFKNLAETLFAFWSVFLKKNEKKIFSEKRK